MSGNPKIGSWFYSLQNPKLTKREQYVAYLLEGIGILTIILLTWLKYRPVTEMSALAAILLLSSFILLSVVYFVFYVKSAVRKKLDEKMTHESESPLP